MEFHVNFYAIVAATVAAMVIGRLWYGPILGKQWMKENKFNNVTYGAKQKIMAHPFWLRHSGLYHHGRNNWSHSVTQVLTLVYH